MDDGEEEEGEELDPPPCPTERRVFPGGSGTEADELTELRNYTVIDGVLRIEPGATEEDFVWLGCIEEVKVLIVQPEGLAHLPPLPRLRKALRLDVRHTDLVDLTGLEALEEVSNVCVDDNRELVSLEGIDGITTFEYGFEVFNNPKLRDLTAPAQATRIGALFIYDNPVLERLGLHGLENTDVLEVHDNPSLPDCEGYGLLDRLEPKPGKWDLSGNKADSYPDCP